jgi:hypothetical protein
VVTKSILATGLTAYLSLGAVSALAQQPAAALSRQQEIQSLREEMQRISARLDALDKEQGAAQASASVAALQSAANQEKESAAATAAAAADAQQKSLDASFFEGTTFNFTLDGYYAYNFDQPIGRVNLLRAYDISSDSFSINQATFVVEHLPQPVAGKRYGGRVDLQFGQATETLGGNPNNELRPQVWRNLFQAYGSYLAPIGSGLEVDFGKWASILGAEGNYTKDQINYSRSFLFNYLPFYHLGFRANYNLNSKVNLAYWAVNGAQQSEDFNGSKSQAIIATLKPAAAVTWNVNYYFGAEGRDVTENLNPGAPTQPTQPGLPTANISPAPNGREHIFDTYATWTASKKLTLVGEADYVIDRTFEESAPAHVAAGAFYARYALPQDYAVAGRAEYFDDRDGLFSGKTQALKEFTLTLDKQLQPGFLARFEYRRDFSNQPFFLTSSSGVLTGAQPTLTVGLVYWLGQKQGSW